MTSSPDDNRRAACLEPSRQPLAKKMHLSKDYASLPRTPALGWPQVMEAINRASSDLVTSPGLRLRPGSDEGLGVVHHLQQAPPV